MAHETTLKNRSAGLDLAEQHYQAAIDILTPSEPYNLDDLLSPISPRHEQDHDITRFRRMSNNSYDSAGSNSTSTSNDQNRSWQRIDSPHLAPPGSAPSHGPSFRAHRLRPVPIMTINASRAYHEEQFSAELFSFLSLIHRHLDNVRQLRSATPGSWLRSRSSASSRSESRGSSNCSEGDMEQLRWARKSVNFRPRFDPTGIQKLCSEALAEL